MRRSVSLGLAFLVGAVAPSVGQTLAPAPGATEQRQPGVLSGPQSRDEIRPQNDREIGDDRRTDGSVGAAGNPDAGLNTTPDGSVGPSGAPATDPAYVAEPPGPAPLPGASAPR